MKTTVLSIPQLALIAGTRAILGAGIALLVSNHLNESQRKAVGIALSAIGILTTVPIALEVFGNSADVTK